MSDFWMSTKSPAGMFRPAYQTGEMDEFLRETAGVDAAILSADLGICRAHVEACQRRIGLRKITGNHRRKPKA